MMGHEGCEPYERSGPGKKRHARKVALFSRGKKNRKEKKPLFLLQNAQRIERLSKRKGGTLKRKRQKGRNGPRVSTIKGKEKIWRGKEEGSERCLPAAENPFQKGSKEGCKLNWGRVN